MDDHAAHDDRTEPHGFSRLAHRVTATTGSGWAAGAVVGAFCAWLAAGAAAGFPRWWEVSGSAGLPFATLLMLVVIQHTQNHDDRATQLKLDELIRANQEATNRMMAVEDASARDLERIRRNFRDQAEAAARQR